jgi:hypothetical protein
MINLFSSFSISSTLATDTGKHFDVVGVLVELIVCFEQTSFCTKISSQIRSSFSSSAFDPIIIEEKSFVDRSPVPF